MKPYADWVTRNFIYMSTIRNKKLYGGTWRENYDTAKKMVYYVCSRPYQ